MCGRVLAVLFILQFLTGIWPNFAIAKEIQYPVNITFDYKDFPGEIETWNVKEDSQFDVSETKIHRKKNDLPITTRLKSPVSIESGGGRTFALVVRNKSSKPIYFFAAPHTAHPADNALRFQFLCFCNHHVYMVPPNSFWYRLVRLELGKTYGSKKLELRHTVVGLTKQQVDSQYSDLVYEIKKEQ